MPHRHREQHPVVVGILIALAVSATLPAAVHAQDKPDPRTTVTNAGALVPFLEGTDVFFALHEDTVFEADIMPHMVAYQNFTDLLNLSAQADRARQGKKAKQVAISVTGTPAVRIRMFDQVSSPVRTPSYMPRGNFQMIWVREVGAFASQFQAGRKGSLSGLDRVSVWEGHFTIGLHSNGQDGCFFADEERIDEVCVSVQPVVGERQVNKHDGSFSTNYIRFGTNYRKNVLDEEWWALKEYGFRAELEYHPRAWMDENMVDLYGRVRGKFAGIFATRLLSWCPKRAEAEAGLEVIGGHPDSVWPVAVTVKGACYPTRQGGWGIFVRYYGGQDYYNLGLLDNIQRVHVGATFNQSGFFRFRQPDQGQGSGGVKP
jgi:hypothetical protein